MAKINKVWLITVLTLVVAVILNVIPFIFIKQDSSLFSYVGATVSAANLVITGFAAGLGFYLAKNLTEK
jgi:hypothetical protein